MALADRVTIYNMVRLLLEEGDIIQVVDENDDLVKLLNIIYEDGRDQLFELHPWRFCARMAMPAAYAEAPAFRWDYQYQLPGDFIKIRHLSSDGEFNGAPVPFELGIIDVGDANDITQTRVLMCDVSGPLYMQYTARIEDERLFSPLFTSTLAAWLALMICHSQTGKQSFVQRIQATFDRNFSAAVASDGSQGTQEQAITARNGPTPSWLAARQI